MNQSESIKELAAALCKAQAAMGGASKDKENPFFKKNYADLGSVVAAIKGPFADNGLSYSQFPVSTDTSVGVDTILMHESGEWLSMSYYLPMTKADPQKAGSAITYARRYALQSIAGIPSEDDDGNAASQPSQNNNRQQGANQPAQMKMTVDSFLALDNDARTAAWSGLTPALQTAINLVAR